jgi:hypothetical protein
MIFQFLSNSALPETKYYEQYMSQAIAEIGHFQKCLEFPQLPRHFQKNNFIIKMFEFLETAQQHQKDFTKLTLPNPT